MNGDRIDSSRRRFLGTIGGGALAAGALGSMPGVLGKVLHAEEAPGRMQAGNTLRRPPLFTGASLNAAVLAQNVWPDMTTTVWTYGGSYPAPTIRRRRGERFTVMLNNELPEETNIHWHGLLVPADMDGHAMDVVGPGQRKEFDFTIDQRAGTYWYHPHPDMKTGKQVFKGMAGFFIVEDDEELALGLPSGEYEIPLVIQDRRLRSDRAFDYTLVMADQMDGFLGDAFLANGTPDAAVDLERTLYRFRVLNGSNARLYKLALSDGGEFHVIGTDCGLLDKPYAVRSLFLGPAERVDLLIDLSGYSVGTSIRLIAENFDGAVDWTMQGWGGDILTMNIVSDGPQRALPTSLATLERLELSQASRTRTFEFEMVVPMPPKGMHTINDRVFHGMRIDETVTAGDVELWVLKSTSDEPHPVHIHGAMFQIVDRNGAAITDPKDMGWKDTVIIWGEDTVRVLVRFGAHPGVFLLHCHNLEHEDDGMMMNYMITATSSAVEQERPVEKIDLF